MEKKYAKLDLSMLSNKPSKIVSSKEALKDVTRFDWAQEVTNGNKKVSISAKRK